MSIKSHPPFKNKLIVTARFKNLKRIRKFIEKNARKAGFDESETYKIQLAVDEACSNIIEHAYTKDSEGEIICECESDKEQITIQLVDHGQSFDPARIEPPDLQSTLDDRKTGGLGLYFIRRLMDEVSFKIISEETQAEKTGVVNRPANILVMVKRRSLPK